VRISAALINKNLADGFGSAYPKGYLSKHSTKCEDTIKVRLAAFLNTDLDQF
jgi:hypothetical protein